MLLFLDVVCVAIIVFFSYRYIAVLRRMKQDIILPAANEEITSIRIFSQKKLDFPSNHKRKAGIIMYSLVLVLIIAIFIFGKITDFVDWTIYPLLFLPLINGDNLINVFAVQKDGILNGGRFIRWSRIKEYQFIPIDLNHKFYGYADEVNHGYELMVKTNGFPVSCIVTSNEMKEKLDSLLSEHVQRKGSR